MKTSESRLKASRKWKGNHKVELKEYKRQWKEKNEEHVQSYQKDWIEKNREHVSNYNKGYYHSHLDIVHAIWEKRKVDRNERKAELR